MNEGLTGLVQHGGFSMCQKGMRGHDLHAQSDVMVHLEGEIMSDDEDLITRERETMMKLQRAGCEAKHNMRVFDVHLKQAEETAAALRLSTPPFHLGTVCQYYSPAHSLRSSVHLQLLLGSRNIRCSKRCGGSHWNDIDLIADASEKI
ncbi:hypothetical protein F2P79_023527 [Pimephales promelas]|nr:hypothetical protein F2P79_023527 [Pimephales promelas]